MHDVLTTAITLLAYTATVAFAVYYTRRSGLDATVMQWMAVWGIMGAMWGGHLFVVMADLEAVIQQPTMLIDFTSGNKSVIGAFAGAAMFGFVYLYLTRVCLLRYADAAVPAVALGYAIARIACFVNGDDFGIVTDVPWAVEFGPATEAFRLHVERGWIAADAGQSKPVHATQLYHALAGIAGFLILVKWKPRFAGSRLALGLFYYGVTRFVIQFYRYDHALDSAAIDTSQWMSLILVFAGLLLWLKNGLSVRSNRFGSPVNNGA